MRSKLTTGVCEVCSPGVRRGVLKGVREEEEEEVVGRRGVWRGAGGGAMADDGPDMAGEQR